MGESKHAVKVSNGEELGFAVFHPPRLSKGLTLWAMAVSAAIIGDTFKSTTVALLDVTSERCGAAGFNCSHHFEVHKRQRMLSAIVRAIGAKDIGYFPLRAPALCRHLMIGGVVHDALLSGRWERSDVQ